MRMLWLFDMYEDGVKCSHWPAISYRLDTFGQDDERVVDLALFAPQYRISVGERPDIPGVV